MEPETEIPETDDTCEKIKSNGERCRAMAMAGSQYCFFHDPSVIEARKAAQRQGGQENGQEVLSADVADVPLHSGKDVAGFLAETINQVRKGQVSPKIASTVGYLSSLLMKALDTTDLEERLAKVEQVLQMRGADESLFNPERG
jgi:transcriptional regulator with GAF, ATPase, and Fis domain